MSMAALTLAGAAVLSASMLGWLKPASPWQDATGWNRLTREQRTAARPPLAAGMIVSASLPVLHPSADDAITTSNPQGLVWLGHAGFLLSQGSTRVLIDPNLNDHCSVARRQLAGPSLGTIDAQLNTIDTIDTIDAVLISHAHMDHLDLPTLRALAGNVHRLIVPQGAERYFTGDEWKTIEILPLAIDDSVTVGDFEITAVPAAHNGNRLHPFESNVLAAGYIVETSRPQLFYFAGDTARRNDFESIARSYLAQPSRDQAHRPTTAVLPIGAFSPRFPLADYHLSPEEAVDVGLLLGVDTVVPSHFGTFRLSLDRPDVALPRFAAEAERRGMHWQMPLLLGSDALSQPTAIALQVASR
jgi:L-ascorbate metabolism protein UlaG (beta-lactamase superfamily)